ncbi:MAG: efflux RND transporter permease subunit, partial [Sphingobacteriales bacterium]
KGVSGWIRRTPYVLVMLVVLFAGLGLLFRNKPTGFIPTEDEGRVLVTYELPEAASTTRSVAMNKELIERIGKLPEVRVAGGIAGLNIISYSNKTNVGTVFVLLKPWDDRKGAEHHVQAVAAKIRATVADLREARVLAILPPAIPGLGQSSGFNFQLEQTTSTDDIRQFEKVAQKFLAAVNARPEIEKAFTFFNARTPTYKIDVDREKAKQLNVNIASVYTTLSTLLGSTYVNDINLYGRNFRVMAQADSTYRSSLDKLGAYYVRNGSGGMVPLTSLITTTQVEAPALISHYNIYRSVEINGNAKPGYSSGQAIEALKEVAAQTLPAGYSYEFSGMSREEIKAGSSAVYIFSLSLVFVFLFLAALYESWSIPFSVL